jgi:hypothetical protein
VRLQGTHAQLVSQGEGLAVLRFGFLHIRGIVLRGDLAEELQGPRRVAAASC